MLRRFNAKLAEAVAAMQASREGKRAALRELQAGLRGEGEGQEMVRVHEEVSWWVWGVVWCGVVWCGLNRGIWLYNLLALLTYSPTFVVVGSCVAVHAQMVACRGAIAKQRAAKAAAQAVSACVRACVRVRPSAQHNTIQYITIQ